jgi:hypothetical protein
VNHIAIVADRRRERMGSQLYCMVDADFLTMDDGKLGCTGNHLQAWQWHAEHPSEWAITLEDDAVPVEGFTEQLEVALAAAPTPIVSLYLGRGYVSDTHVGADVRRAESVGAHWLVGAGPLHAVALALRGELVGPMIEAVQRSRLAIDHAMSGWARRSGYRTAYSIPSLVDHRDTPSLVVRYRRSPRVAWRMGTRDQWTDSAISMV